MIVISREVFVCKCSTDVPLEDEEAGELAARVVFGRGTESDLSSLDPGHHNAEHVEDLRARLRRGEHWLLGRDPAKSGAIVSYTWLHTRSRIDYPYLPGCAFSIAADVGYGYDAWTPPDLRGGGLRRRGFLKELRVLRDLGMNWEASFFVKHQLEGATRSLSKAGITIVPLWRARLERGRTLSFEKLVDDAGTAAAPIVSSVSVSGP